MRHGRDKFDGPGYYHLGSRVVGKLRILDDVKEKCIFYNLMRRCETFCGVRVLDYSIMGNHFHLLIFAPGICTADEEEILRRIGVLYGLDEQKEVREQWETWRKIGADSAVEADKDRYRAMMGDISEFMKLLKQRYSISFNHRHGREGTLWERRFFSVLVGKEALPYVSGYITLNSVRAHLKESPEEYIWAGYGEAVAGSEIAQERLAEVYGTDLKTTPWNKILSQHRILIYTQGAVDGKHMPVFSEKQVTEILKAGGKLPTFDLLRCRVRYFVSGFAIGSKEFVEMVFKKFRRSFGSKRKTGSRPFRYSEEWTDKIFVARDLRKEVIRPMTS